MGAAADGPARRGGTTAGVAYALAAFLFWGGVPVYFKAVGHVPAPIEPPSCHKGASLQRAVRPTQPPKAQGRAIANKR